jgi:hypothetical protein
LTSRPGLYAAPSFAARSSFARKLITILRRAGYLESTASDVWSGSFDIKPSQIIIRPSRVNNQSPPIITLSFSGNEIADLKADNISIDSFTLEPEILSNDLSSKGGKHEVLTYSEIPPNLVHAILSIEDRRFLVTPS